MHWAHFDSRDLFSSKSSLIFQSFISPVHCSHQILNPSLTSGANPQPSKLNICFGICDLGHILSMLFLKHSSQAFSFFLFWKTHKQIDNRSGFESPMPTAAVQKLYEACNENFSSVVAPDPSSRSIQTLRSVLDSIKPIDVGLTEELFENIYGYGFFEPNVQNGEHSTIAAQWEAPITYFHVYECDRFSIGIFCLPASAVIPFHDHPRMTVFSKLLFGSMHIKAYDWVYPTDTEPNTSQVRLAKLKIDNIFRAPCSTSILYPTSGGNIHQFTAVTSCAVLDVLVPPYCDTAGRSCTYYCEYPYSSLPDDGNMITDLDSKGCYAWLEEIEKPDDFIVEGAEYKGPLIEAR